MVTHECKQEQNIGAFKEFMQASKGMRAAIISMAGAIFVQVFTFMFLWGRLTMTVDTNTNYLWKTISPATTENTRNIDKILARFDVLQTKAFAEEKKINKGE